VISNHRSLLGKDLGNMRLVSKEWRSAVDRSDHLRLNTNDTVQQFIEAVAAGQFRHITSLSLYHYVSDEGLSLLANSLAIKELRLYSCPITDRGLNHFGTLPNLRHLAINASDSVTNDGLRSLAELPLESLEIRALTEVSGGAFLEHLPQGLRNLSVSMMHRVLGEHLEHVASLPELRTFTADHNRAIAAGSVPHLITMANKQIQVIISHQKIKNVQEFSEQDRASLIRAGFIIAQTDRAFQLTNKPIP
jgi:hypothetical protein